MNNSTKITKRIPQKLTAIGIFFIVSIALFHFYNSINSDNNSIQQDNIIMDYTIYPSTIPENQLLRIKEAKELYSRAFDNQVFYTVEVPDELVKFIKHAWQWDKNAMPYYYDLLHWHDLYDENVREDGYISFTEFMKKYRDQLVDNTGKPLVEPVVFKNPDMNSYLWNKFADLKYPKFAYEKGWKFSPCKGNKNGEYLPCTDEQLKESIKYFTYALEGGYHCYEDLTARMLFQQGDHYKNNDFKKINKLTEYRKSLTPEDLKLAIDYTEIMAEHSSIIGILRVTEAYLYGLGREQDLVKAYAWTLLSDYAKQTIIEIGNNLAWDYYQLPPVWQYNKEIQTRLEKILTPEQKQAAQNELAELKTKIIIWNYNRWENQIDDFHPKP